MSFIVFTALFVGRSLAESSPWTFTWTDDPVGPDGPWNALFVPVDSPLQNLTLLPSLTETSLFIQEAACSNQSSACPNPRPDTMWTSSTAHATYLYMNSEPWKASSWDDTVSGPLRLQGSGYWMHDKITLWSESDSVDLLEQAASLTEDFTVRFPGDAKYTMDVGFFSLNGAEENITWTSTNGSQITLNTQLPYGYSKTYPSISYGLHVGSPNLEIDPSLVLGGYDRARCLTDPISSSNQTFELLDIGLGVQEGESAFVSQVNNTVTAGSNGSVSGLLGDNTGIQAMPNPGVPYLYLPQDTCDAIAKYLPVTYNSTFGLYTWNTDDSTFEAIVSSPSFLSFTLKGSSSSNLTINVPFALLNLTLDNPLVATPMPYFPCSPYSPSDETYHLGRAFLQAALLAQNWQSNTVWLAQAPGPDVPSVQITTISSSDTTLARMVSPPDWYSTWSSSLKALPTGSNRTSSIGGTMAPTSTGLSGGAIAGIVIGVVAALAIIGLAAFFLVRRRRGRSSVQHDPVPSEPNSSNHNTLVAAEADEKGTTEAGSTPIYEVASPDKGPEWAEMPSPDKEPNQGEASMFPHEVQPAEVQGSDIAELPGHVVERR